jgi:ribosomal protein L11
VSVGGAGAGDPQPPFGPALGGAAGVNPVTHCQVKTTI